MRPTFFRRIAPPTLIAVALAPAFPARAFDVNDRLSIDGVLAAAGQCQSVSALLPAETYGDPPWGAAMNAFDNECRGGMPFQLEISYRPDDSNEFFVKLGFATGSGLNETSPWNLSPWAADLEDDVRDINGRNRDYLLTAWYKYTRTFSNESTLGASFGLLDAIDYLDKNAYANDEYTQFSNEVFVNAGNYNFPNYDAGAALEWAYGPWSLKGIGMNVGENDDGNNFNFWGMQAAYRADTAFGAGNYRFILTGTSAAFLDPTAAEEERHFAGGISFDQEFGAVVGGFLRFARQRDEASADYESLYSGGLDFKGSGWGRDEDNIGIGAAYLDGGNQNIRSSRVFEGYYRAVLNKYVAVTADAQYMKDAVTRVDPRQDNPEGWIFGLRLVAEF